MPFWILDSAIGTFLFQESTIVEQLFDPRGMKIYFRLTVGGLLIALVRFRIDINVRKEAEEGLKKAGFYIDAMGGPYHTQHGKGGHQTEQGRYGIIGLFSRP